MIPYRNLTQASRSVSAQLRFRHTDLWLSGNHPALTQPAGLKAIRTELVRLYGILDDQIAAEPAFQDSLSPIDSTSTQPIVCDMVEAAKKAGVGPMAAVAGAMADHVLAFLGNDRDLFIENGGDVALNCRQTTRIRIYTGWKRSHAAVSLTLPKGRFGVASSSGRYGQSLSLGQADMVTTIAETGALADAYATAMANEIVAGIDLQDALNSMTGALAVAVAHNGAFAYRGPFALDFG